MTSQLSSISPTLLDNVTGGAGAGFNTGITGGIKGINNKVPAPPSQSGGFNTGITGGIHGVPNNKVPAPRPGNTGITGGIHGVPNNRVPWFLPSWF